MWNSHFQKLMVASITLLLCLTEPVAGQDIAVSGSTHELIPDGSPASLSLGTVYFPITVSGSSAGIFFEIHNTDLTENLVISSIAKAGSHASDFSLGSIDSNIIPPGETRDFLINCNPSAVGDRVAVITINSNDPDAESVYTFGLSCFGYESDSDLVSKAAINVGLLDGPTAKSNKAGTTRFKAKVHVGNLGTLPVEDPVLQVFWSDLPYLSPNDMAYEKPLKAFPAYESIGAFKRKNVKVKLKIPDTSAYVFARIVSAGSVSEYNYTDNTIKMPFGDH